MFEGHLFQIAAMCIRFCNNHRRSRVDDSSISDLVDRLWSIRPPGFDNRFGDADWQQAMSRMAYIQMPFQAFRGEMLARSVCLFGTDSMFGQPVLDTGWVGGNHGGHAIPIPKDWVRDVCVRTAV